MIFNIGKKLLGASLLALLLNACGGGGGSSGTSVTHFTIGGIISGLAGSVILQNNSGDNLTVTANGSFTFASAIANDSTYTVSVLTQPTGQICSVSTGAGTVSGSNISNVTVTCATNAYSVGGIVSGLSGSVVLQNNSGDNLSISANGTFTFATPVANGSPYSVTVLTQPSASMSCSVTNGAGTISLGNVSNVTLTCAINTYTVGGTVSGLNGSMVLQNKGADNHSVSVNGPFSFPTVAASGDTYLVSILSKPVAQHCAVSSGAGTVTTGNISNVGVACLNNQLGGAIQTGTQLNLTTAVSTIAGAAPGADGTGGAARFGGPYASVSDGTNLYVADMDNHLIRQIVIASGAVTTLAGTKGVTGSADGTGTAAKFNSPSGIIIDDTNTNLYVTDRSNQTIRKIVISSGVVTTLAGTAGATGSTDNTGTAARFLYPTSLTFTGGFLYVVDSNNHTLRKIEIATGVVTTLAGTAGMPESTDGTGPAARFNYPFGITTDNTNLYVTEDGNHTIRKIVIASGVVTTLAGTVGVPGAVDATGSAAKFNQPRGITIDGVNLYIADSFNQTIRQVVIASGVVTTLAGTSGVPGAVDATGTAAMFNYPTGITGNSGNLYVADRLSHTIRKIVIASKVVTTLAGAANIIGAVDATGAAARFSTPDNITTDGSNLYVTDHTTCTIRKIVIASGAVTTLAGTTGVQGATDGTGTAATFSSPYGITTDGSVLYVADTGNHTIRKIVISTGVVTTLAGAAGIQGSTDGTGTAATFSSPFGITTDGSNLYVADRDNHSIRKIVISTGVVTTLAGTAGTPGLVDGIGTAATFQAPSSVITDGSNLYVTDTGNHTVRKIVISSGVVTTLAGTAGAPGSTDGTGADATFSSPYGITTDGNNLYVAEWDNHTIRKIVISTGVVTTLAGTAGAPGGVDATGTAARFRNPYGITSDGGNLFVTDSNNNTIRKIQ